MKHCNADKPWAPGGGRSGSWCVQRCCGGGSEGRRQEVQEGVWPVAVGDLSWLWGVGWSIDPGQA